MKQSNDKNNNINNQMIRNNNIQGMNPNINNQMIRYNNIQDMNSNLNNQNKQRNIRNFLLN